MKIEEEIQELPTEGLYLLMIFQHEVFPHLAFINQSKYWSLGNFRVHRAAPGLPKWNSFKRKNLQVILLEIPGSGNDENLLNEAFSNAKPLHSGNQTCLSPVLEFFRRKAEKNLNAEIVRELIPELNKLNFIYKVSALNIPTGMYSIANYSREDVISAITIRNSTN